MPAVCQDLSDVNSVLDKMSILQKKPPAAMDITEECKSPPLACSPSLIRSPSSLRNNVDVNLSRKSQSVHQQPQKIECNATRISVIKNEEVLRSENSLLQVNKIDPLSRPVAIFRASRVSRGRQGPSSQRQAYRYYDVETLAGPERGLEKNGRFIGSNETPTVIQENTLTV